VSSLRTILVGALVLLTAGLLVDGSPVEASAGIVAAGAVVHAHQVGALAHLSKFASSVLDAELLGCLLVYAGSGRFGGKLVACRRVHIQVSELRRGSGFEFVDQLEHLLDVDLPSVVLVEYLEHLLVLLAIQVELVGLRSLGFHVELVLGLV